MFHSQIAFILLTYLQEKKSIHNKKNTILRLFYIHSNLFHLKIAKAAAPGGRGREGGEDRGRRGKPLKIIYLLFHFLHNARRKSKTFLKKLFLEQEEKKLRFLFFIRRNNSPGAHYAIWGGSYAVRAVKEGNSSQRG